MNMHECNLPPYLAHDLEAYKKGLEEHSHLLYCLWGELYGSINSAEIDDGALTHWQAQYLRDRYLWGKGCMMEAIDFTSCPRLPNRACNGANGKKIGYVDFISANRAGVLAPSLKRIVPKIDMNAIYRLVDGTPLLTDLQRDYITARYEVMCESGGK